MNYPEFPRRHLPWVALALLLLAAAGCEEPRPEIVPVSGTVRIDGQPLTLGSVQVIPSGYRAAFGKIDENGRFSLTTYEPGDGCVLGTHQVAISACEVLNAGQQKWHAPKKYLDATRSGLTATVDGPTDNLEINISWEGGKPFIERTGE